MIRLETEREISLAIGATRKLENSTVTYFDEAIEFPFATARVRAYVEILEADSVALVIDFGSNFIVEYVILVASFVDDSCTNPRSARKILRVFRL